MSRRQIAADVAWLFRLYNHVRSWQVVYVHPLPRYLSYADWRRCVGAFTLDKLSAVIHQRQMG